MMYTRLGCVPYKLIQCMYTGYAAVTTYNERDSTVVVYNDRLTLVDRFWRGRMNVGDSDSVGTSVKRDGEIVEVIISVTRLRDDDDGMMSWDFSSEYSNPTTPMAMSRVFNVGSILYSVPSDLITFINLPQVQSYNRKMIKSIHALSRYLYLPELIATIIVFSVQSYHELDYEQYCRELEHSMSDDDSR